MVAVTLCGRDCEAAGWSGQVGELLPCTLYRIGPIDRITPKCIGTYSRIISTSGHVNVITNNRKSKIRQSPGQCCHFSNLTVAGQWIKINDPGSVCDAISVFTPK